MNPQDKEASVSPDPQSAPPSSARTVIKNVVLFVLSGLAAVGIIQGWKLLVYPWLVANGLWPL
jgi:hypothetical protein